MKVEHLHYVKGCRVFMLQAVAVFFYFASLDSATEAIQ